MPVDCAMQGLLRCSLASTKRVILKSLRAVVCMWGHLCAAECSGAQDWWLLQHLQGVQLRCLCRLGRCLHSRAIEEAADDSGCQGQLQAACQAKGDARKGCDNVADKDDRLQRQFTDH